jgi:hypothetical protein
LRQAGRQSVVLAKSWGDWVYNNFGRAFIFYFCQEGKLGLGPVRGLGQM